MRIVFIGLSRLTVTTAQTLLKRGHEVVVIEHDKQKIEEYADTLDCGFIHGDGTKPAILKETNPGDTDFLFCLTDNSQTNIIASLVGRSLGFREIVTRLGDPDFEHVCAELGLTNTIIPIRTISRYLTDMVAGLGVFEISTVFRDEARIFSFVVGDENEGVIGDLKLPSDARVMCYYRDDEFRFADESVELRKGDEVVILTTSGRLPELRKRWNP